MAINNTSKANPAIHSKPTPVVSTAPSLPTTNGNISSNAFSNNCYAINSNFDPH